MKTTPFLCKLAFRAASRCQGSRRGRPGRAAGKKCLCFVVLFIVPLFCVPVVVCVYVFAWCCLFCVMCCFVVFGEAGERSGDGRWGTADSY